MPTPPPDPTQPVDTIPASEVAEVYPFLPPGKDIDSNDSVTPSVSTESFTPDSSENPNGPGTLLLSASTTNSPVQPSDFGYVVLTENDLAGVFNACPLGKFTLADKFYLTVRVPKKPTKIKVTILTRKAIDISNLV